MNEMGFDFSLVLILAVFVIALIAMAFTKNKGAVLDN